MPDDPRAPALAAILERANGFIPPESVVGLPPEALVSDIASLHEDVLALLVVVSAQAARLAAVAQIVFTHEWHVSCCPLLTGALDDALAGASDG